jgi:hypothetical protein
MYNRWQAHHERQRSGAERRARLTDDVNEPLIASRQARGLIFHADERQRELAMGYHRMP